MRNFLQSPPIFSLQSYNSLILNNLHLIIGTKDIYFIYIDKKVSKKLINTLLPFCSKYTYAAYFCTGFAPVLHRVFSAFLLKNRKNSQIFCNFFSLCINDLQES